MNKLLIILLAMGVLCSCERKSGRRNSGMSPNKPPRELTRSSVDRTPESEKNNNSRRVMSPPAIYEKYNSAVFMIFTSDGTSDFQGSGFFISSSGLAVSNYHVFKGTTIGFEIIKLTNNQKFKVAEVVTYNEALDYILFKVDIGNVKVNHIPISSLSPQIGEKAYAIGSPRGLENTFSSGEISQIRDKYVLQISVPIDHGSSGGALINSYGEAIGITTSGLDTSGANLNFAMSIRVIDKLLKK